MVESSPSTDLPLDDPPSADEDVAQLRLQLRDRTLAKLEADGLVVYDRENHVVKKGPAFENKRPPVRSD